jgi:hypothetical protein
MVAVHAPPSKAFLRYASISCGSVETKRERGERWVVLCYKVAGGYRDDGTATTFC